MNHLDLFSGIGAFSLAAKRVGIDTRFFSEINKDAIEVLARQFPHIPNLGSVTDIDGTRLDTIDIVTGGFPCTDLSQSAKGSHKGLEGSESGLFYELARIVNECNPRWVVIENVTRVVKYMDKIKEEMPHYEWEVEVFEAAEFGANCRRKRAFLVGCTEPGRPREVLDFTKKQRSPVQRGGDEDVFPMCLPWKGGVSLERLGSCVIEIEEANATGIRKGNGVPRGMDFSDGARYLMLGNSIVPIIPQRIFQGILSTECVCEYLDIH